MRRGFSLTELITIMAIFAMVAGFSLMAVAEGRARTRDDRRITDLKLLQTTLELYRVDVDRGVNPNPLTPGVAYPRYYLQGTDYSGDGLYGNAVFERYLTQVPNDPTRNRPYIYFSPGCVRPGAGIQGDATIISPARDAAYHTIQSLDSTPDGLEPCPAGSGWLPYVVYGLLEKPRVGSVSRAGLVNLTGSGQAVAYGAAQPLFKSSDPRANSGIFQGFSRCFPATGNCLTGY